jgi:broad-specificity NMP kinase
MKIPQITIKYSKALESSTQVILEKDYYKAKARLEKLGYKVEKI